MRTIILVSVILNACVPDRPPEPSSNCDQVAAHVVATPGQCQAFFWSDEHVVLGDLIAVDGADTAQYTNLITTNGEPGVIVWRDSHTSCLLDPCIQLPGGN